MVIMGNPPYSSVSSNNGDWITNLIEDYKYIDGKHFNERKHWLNDDYVKFIRFGQHFIDKNGEGILAFINPHGFLDNTTFRGMRSHLLRSFDTIYTIDLHGNSKKKEVSPDGTPDVNVFDIMQGVSINLFVKNKNRSEDASVIVKHFDLYGKRDDKYRFLTTHNLKDISFKTLNPKIPYFFLVPKDDEHLLSYNQGFKIDEIFRHNNVGFVSANDILNLSFSENDQRNKINDIINLDENSWRQRYERPYDSQSWKYLWAKEDAEKNRESELTKINYRPFDFRWSLYTGKSGGLFARPSYQIMKNLKDRENIGLVIPKINKEDNCFFISNKIISHKFCSAYDSNSIFPLYDYEKQNGQLKVSIDQKRIPNLNMEIVNKFAKGAGLYFAPEENPKGATVETNQFLPIDLLDYIYAVLNVRNTGRNIKNF